jgi:hypothetical protein
MSGGSYNYLYSRIDEIAHWAGDLEAMADECMHVAETIKTKRVESVPGSHILDKDVPITAEERARLMAKSLLLKGAAKKLRDAHATLETLEDIMHDVEWASSCDYSWDQLMEPEP